MVNVSYVFGVGEIRVCHNVSIINDAICEPDENFSFLLEYVSSGELPINLDQPSTDVIIDDTVEPECGKLKSYIKIFVISNAKSLCDYIRNHELRY